jgi:hypothetical protein
MYQTIRQFSQAENLPEMSVRKLCRSGEFPAIVLGGAYQIDVEAAREWLKSRQKQPDAPAGKITRGKKIPFLEAVKREREAVLKGREA